MGVYENDRPVLSGERLIFILAETMIRAGVLASQNPFMRALLWVKYQALALIWVFQYGWHTAFDSPPKPIIMATDSSGSMSCGQSVMNGLFSPREVATVQAMVTARVEPEHAIVLFDGHLRVADISAHDKLDSALRKVPADGGMTDYSLPMKWAREEGIQTDSFVLIGDNCTWSGDRHASQALTEYRNKMQRPDTKLISVLTNASRGTVGDPSDINTMTVCGFDTATPQAISLFLR